MDLDYDPDPDHEHEQGEHDSGHRPQSRASQHSQQSADSNGYARHQARNQRHGAPHDPHPSSPYAYQQGQFDDPDREEDDDMW